MWGSVVGTNFNGFLKLPLWGNRPRLTIAMILGWADAHRAATGDWPTTSSGSVRQAPFSEKWVTISEALRSGHRGLPGGQSLALLLAEHRGVEPFLTEEGGRRRVKICRRLLNERLALKGRVTLSVERILAWADAHQAATGRWPSEHSGPIRGVPGETWSTINRALFGGRRGLPGGKGLNGILADHRGRTVWHKKRASELSVEQILAWADTHHATNGRWPIIQSGALAEVPEESWVSIDRALRNGGRAAGRHLAPPPAAGAPRCPQSVGAPSAPDRPDPGLGRRAPHRDREMALTVFG